MRAVALHLTNSCTFGRRLLENSYLATLERIFPTFPRSYCHPTQPKCKKNNLENQLSFVFLAFMHIFLYLCSRFCARANANKNIIEYKSINIDKRNG